MAKITRSLAKGLSGGKAEILLRVAVSGYLRIRIKSGIFIEPSSFKDGAFVYPRSNQKKSQIVHDTENRLKDLESLLMQECISNPNADKDALNSIVSDFHGWADNLAAQAEKPQENQSKCGFFDAWEKFLAERSLSKNRRDIYQSLARALHRFEMHTRCTANKGYSLSLQYLSSDDLRNFENFYRNEWSYYEKFPKIYLQYPADLRPQHLTHRPQKRGSNICALMMSKVRTFCNWAVREGLMQSNPFDHYEVDSERYGKVWFLTLEERDRLADFDFGENKILAEQRDIFIFQCLVGCRVSDLKNLKKSNIVGGALEYVARKTKRETLDTIRVPLNTRARAIVEKYKGLQGERLFPFISDQRYNDRIKEMLRIAGIDRMVTVINPTTGEDERRPIWEIASSHLARRTFIGNLYKKVKDQNLIGSMSGHAEGSRAFARYRDIDDEIKGEAVGLID